MINPIEKKLRRNLKWLRASNKMTQTTDYGLQVGNKYFY